MNRIKSTRIGFTLVELLVVIGIIALLIAILLPALSKARESGYRVACGSNLHQIGLMMLVYANDNKGSFPRTYWRQDFTGSAGKATSPGGDHTYNGLRGFTNPASLDPFVNPTSECLSPPWDPTKAPGGNDVTAALFLLIRVEHMAPAAFICPSRSIFYPDKLNGQTFSQRSNFSSPYNLSYSVSIPYLLDDAAVSQCGYKWGTTCKPGFALMADLNPGESFNGPFGPSCVVTVSSFYNGVGPVSPKDPTVLQRRANSNNHRKAGQNVLYGDGSVVWHTNAFAGNLQDNIYTMSTPTSNAYTSGTQYYSPAGPTFGTDSMMQPNEGALTLGVGIGIN